MSLIVGWTFTLAQSQPSMAASIMAPSIMAFAAWLALIAVCHRVQLKGPRFVLVILRSVSSLIFWHQLLQLVAELVETSRAWPLWLLAGSAAIASELILLTYDQPHHAGVDTIRSWLQRLFLGLRLALVGMIAVLLMEPALSREEEKNEERTIAILADASRSMTLPTRSSIHPKQPRSELATDLLSGLDDSHNGLLSQISDSYSLKLYEFGATAREVLIDETNAILQKEAASDAVGPRTNIAAEESQWAQSTDLAAALRKVNEDTPIDQLSGVIVLTDGCDHSRTDVQQPVRSFTRRMVPVNSVVIGSQEPIRDAAILSLDAPPQIYQGDSVSLQTTLRADHLKGTTAVVRLLEDDNLLEERSIAITGDKHRESIVFRHEPEDAGIHRYRVELSRLNGEETTDNNLAARNVWVSNDQIRVLLIEDRPRWEFRYLRNLFAGRCRRSKLHAARLSKQSSR